MSKYLMDDPWFEYLELSAGPHDGRREQGRQKRALNKRIAHFRRSRRTKPFAKF